VRIASPRSQSLRTDWDVRRIGEAENLRTHKYTRQVNADPDQLTIGSIIDRNYHDILCDRERRPVVVLKTTSAELQVALVFRQLTVKVSRLVTTYTKEPEYHWLLAAICHIG